MGDSEKNSSVTLTRMVSAAKRPEDLADIFAFLADCAVNKDFPWGNGDIVSFLKGMSLATEVFENAPFGDFEEILAQGPWRVLAEITAMGLVLD